MFISLKKLFSLICSNKQTDPTKTTRFSEEEQASIFIAVAYNENNAYRCGFDIKIRRMKNRTFWINIDSKREKMITQ
jgi:hypothetical protein